MGSAERQKRRYERARPALTKAEFLAELRHLWLSSGGAHPRQLSRGAPQRRSVAVVTSASP